MNPSRLEVGSALKFFPRQFGLEDFLGRCLLTQNSQGVASSHATPLGVTQAPVRLFVAAAS